MDGYGRENKITLYSNFQTPHPSSSSLALSNIRDGLDNLVLRVLNTIPTDRRPQCVTKCTGRKQKAKECKRLKSIEKTF